MADSYKNLAGLDRRRHALIGRAGHVRTRIADDMPDQRYENMLIWHS